MSKAIQKEDYTRVIYDKGCLRAGEEWVERNLVPVAGVAVAISVLQVAISVAISVPHVLHLRPLFSVLHLFNFWLAKLVFSVARSVLQVTPVVRLPSSVLKSLVGRLPHCMESYPSCFLERCLLVTTQELVCTTFDIVLCERKACIRHTRVLQCIFAFLFCFCMFCFN